MKYYTTCIFSLFLISLSSCTLTKYFPSPINTPLLSEKNELRLTAGFESNANISYLPMNNLGVFSSVFFTKETRGTGIQEQIAKHFVFENGVGYYKKFDKNMLAECYIGLGFGSFNIKEKAGTENYKFHAPTTKFFIHPSIGWKKEHIETALSFRLTGLSFGSYETNFSSDQINDNKLSELNRKVNLFWEPAFTFRYGFKTIKINYQTGFSMRLPFTLNLI